MYFYSMFFKDVIGQENLKAHLIKEVINEKVSHAQLFIGKPGYGSLPLALAFVQFLFCENKQENESCGECDSCHQTQKLEHPDLHFSFPTVLAESKTSSPLMKEWRAQVKENPYFSLNTWVKRIDPKKERKPIIGTDESLEIVKKLSLKSFKGGYKVMVIWMAEEMNTTCANKLLKILEEPTPNTLFILIAESSDRMLQTILSRSQVLQLPRIEWNEIANYLRKTKNRSSSLIDSISGRAEGDLLEAIQLTSSGHSQNEYQDEFIQLMRVCYKKSVLEMISWAEDIASKKSAHQKEFLKYALHMFRQSLLKNYSGEILIRVSEEENSFLQKFAQFITGKNIQGFTQTFSDAHYHLERNANSKILFTSLCFQVMRYIHKG